jgi:hypothetical protein
MAMGAETKITLSDIYSRCEWHKFQIIPQAEPSATCAIFDQPDLIFSFVRKSEAQILRILGPVIPGPSKLVNHREGGQLSPLSAFACQEIVKAGIHYGKSQQNLLQFQCESKFAD